MSGIKACFLKDSDYAYGNPSTMAKSLMYYAIGAGRFRMTGKEAWNNQLDDGVVALYLEDGSGILAVDDREYHVKPGDFFLFDKNEKYSAKVVGMLLWVHMDGGNIHEFCNALRNVNGPVYRLMKDNPVPFLMHEIFKELRNRNSRDGLIGAAISSILCVLYDNASHVAMDDAKQGRPIEKAIVYIRQHISERLLVDDIARAASVSPVHLRRIFKDEIKQSPHEYVTHVRIDTAKTILKTTTKSIQEISSELGYTSESNFSAVFKKMTGFAPKEFRESPYG